MVQQRGFTLVELMYVTGTVGVLTAIATPVYQGYVGRAQASEAVGFLAATKAPLADYYANNGAWPQTLAEFGILQQGRYTDRIELTAGADSAEPAATVTATFKTTGVTPPLQGRTLALSTADGGRTWKCRTGDLSEEFVPQVCKS